jgi:hypothetical protein
VPTFLSSIDLTGSEIRNVRAQNLATDPASPAVGQFWFDTNNNVLKYRNNSVTVSVADASGLGALATLSTVGSGEITDGSIMNIDVNASAAIALSKLATDPLARANHTGTQLASTVSDFDTQVRTSSLSQMAVPTGAVSMNGQLLTNLATPLSPADAATKAYADSVAQGLDVKTAVRVASTANVTVSAPGAAIDGVTLASGDRVLLKNQSTGSENGIYVFTAAATPMTRAGDADTSADVNGGMFTFVQEGTANADTGWVLTTNNPITLGTTALSFTQFSGSGNVVGTANRITVTGTQVDISSAYVGQNTITTLGTVTTGTWTGTTIAVANGGTGATTIATARTSLGCTTKYATLIGNGAATTFTVTHSLGTNDVAVEIYDATTMATVYANVTRASTNTVTIDGFTIAPGTNALRVVVVG